MLKKFKISEFVNSLYSIHRQFHFVKKSVYCVIFILHTTDYGNAYHNVYCNVGLHLYKSELYIIVLYVFCINVKVQ